jgi:hypothetical protein
MSREDLISTQIRRALTAAVLMLSLTAASAPAGAASRECKDVVLRTGDGSVYTRTHDLRAARAPCRTARRVARIFLHESEGTGNVRPLGFTCRRSGEGVRCRKTRRRVTWSW